MTAGATNGAGGTGGAGRGKDDGGCTAAVASVFRRAPNPDPRWRAIAVAVICLAVLASAGATACAAPPAVGASRTAVWDERRDVVALVPADTAVARRSREVLLRFPLARRVELTLQINNAFTAQNRRAIARVQTQLAAIPGVRGVVGPAGLLALSVDGTGRVTARPLLGGDGADGAADAARQRLLRRSDAIGWFISRDGTEVRLLIDTDDFGAVREAVSRAAASSGLVLLSGGAPAVPLWPAPGMVAGPVGPWSPLIIVWLLMAVPAAAAALLCRRSGTRALLAALAGALGAAAPALVAPATRLRDVGFQVGFGAAGLILALSTAAGLVTAVRAARAADRARVGGGGAVAPPRGPTRVQLSLVVLIPAAALVGAAIMAWPRLTLGTQLWRPTPFFFVSVRGDLNQPVVLRELRRLTDFLRAEPGVAQAWSVADLFFAVSTPDQDFGSIPASSARVRAILDRARSDAALSLELSPDHQEALVGVRLDDDSGVDRLDVLARLDRYLATAHRTALLPVDISDRRIAPGTRALGRGVLTADAHERVLRICARAGRNLGQREEDAIERAVRRAALLPTVDAGRMRAEAAAEIDRFTEEVALAEAHVGIPGPAERARLTDELWALPPGSALADVERPLRAFYGRRLSAPVLAARAAELGARLAEARRRHTARLNFNDILSSADLPTEGVLSEEVRDATLDAMGPLVGIPVSAGTDGALTLDAAAIGGVACDQALSSAWRPRLRLGLVIAALLLALVLVVGGGIAGLAWWPVGPALAAPLILIAAAAAVPLGTLSLAALAGALAGGFALAAACGVGRRAR